MGCHTWFWRPITKEDRSILRASATDEWLDELKKDLSDFGDCALFKKVKDSLDEDSDFWLRYGWFNGDDFVVKIRDKFYVDTCTSPNQNILLSNPTHYHDVFRVKNYPNWVIHNKRQLRRKLRSKYFELSKHQLDEISNFFREYPGGVIDFG